MDEDAIGGYFGLELNTHSNDLTKWGIGFQSARAGLYAILEKVRPQRVWIPKYICGCVLDPIRALRIEVKSYDINLDFRLTCAPKLQHNDILLYVNYFGICSEQEQELLLRYEPERMIFDHSQALFSPPIEALATIYSPRKFVGIPDGGFVYTNIRLNRPNTQYYGSVENASFLLKRLAEGPEAGYAHFLEADKRLSDFEPRSMSKLTRRLLSSLDFEQIIKKRRLNFDYLHSELGAMNELTMPKQRSAAMCYPLLIRDDKLRERLIERRIFVPTYWPDVPARVSRGSNEQYLVKFLFPLPCDQRYTPKVLGKVVDLVRESVSRG